MQYLCLIYESEALKRSEQESAAHIQAYGVYTEDLKKSGRLVGGEALQPTATATMLRIRNGEMVVSDGPFAETKEQLLGYYLIKAEDLDEAIAAAKGIPTIHTGSIEIRPLIEWHSAS